MINLRFSGNQKYKNIKFVTKHFLKKVHLKIPTLKFFYIILSLCERYFWLPDNLKFIIVYSNSLGPELLFGVISEEVCLLGPLPYVVGLGNISLWPWKFKNQKSFCKKKKKLEIWVTMQRVGFLQPLIRGPLVKNLSIWCQVSTSLVESKKIMSIIEKQREEGKKGRRGRSILLCNALITY